MAIKAAKMKDVVEETEIEFSGETVKLWYRPNVMTPALEKQLRKEQRKFQRLMADDDADDEALEDAHGSFIDILIMVVAEWDVLDDDDNRLPVSRATAEAFPYSFLFKVLEATKATDMDPKGSAT